MEAWAALRCSQVSRTWDGVAGSPQTPHAPSCRLQGGPGQRGWFGTGCPCVFLGDPQSGCLPPCAGDSIMPRTQPSTRGHFKGPGAAACSVGKWLRAGPQGVGSSMEMLLGRGHCGGTSSCWVQDGGSASPAACSCPKSPVCCPFPGGTASWGWHWAKRGSWGGEGARRPVGISPAVLSEVAWVNKHESRREMRGSGRGQHSSSPLCESQKSWGKKRRGERGSPGAAYCKEDPAGCRGVRVGAVPPSPRATA